MLRLFLGGNQDEKLRSYAAQMKKILDRKGKVTAIVPDQFSFAFDKALYRELGAKDFNKVTVLSFKRLSENLIDRFGTDTGMLVSQNDRMVLIYLALRRAGMSKKLRLLSGAVEKTAFCEEISQLIDSFRKGGVLPETLYSAAEKLSGTLSDKLCDIADIFGEYINLLNERSLRDESSVISEGGKIAAKMSAFKGENVFVDRFDSFSFDELTLLKAAVRDADSVTVCLPLPMNSKITLVSPFTHCTATEKVLINLAAETNTHVDFICCDTPTSQDAVLSELGECLFTASHRRVQNCGSVSCIRADSVYEEAEFVAATVRRLVTEENYSFNDIAVITHDMDAYSPVLDAAFERYGVEAFLDRTQPVSGMSLTLYMLDAIEAAATRNPDTEKILKFVRSPFSPLSFSEVSSLWDYCVRWNVDGKMWEQDFTASDGEDLEVINAIRKKVYEPLCRLHEASKSASAKEIASAFCTFLNEIDAAGGVYSVIESCSESEPELKLETARLFKQLWTSVMSAITSVYLIAGDENMTLRVFGELLRRILTETKVSNPPQKLDSVTVADVSRSIIAAPKVAFVVGLCDGAFPADVRKTGLFSGRDISALEAVGVSFDISVESRLSAERFDCYKALTAPTERLYLSFSGSDLRGREQRPSRLLRRIEKYCGVSPVSARSFGARLYCSTPKSAFYNYAVSKYYTAEEKASVYSALSSLPEWREKLSQLDDETAGLHRLTPSVSKDLFVPGDINITASRIDVYNHCNYGYFCKYGLKMLPVRPVEIDPANRGNVMHFIFESVLSYFGSGFSEASDEEILALVDRLLEEYSEQKLGGDFGKTAKFQADYKRLGGAAMEILLNMREEFKVSKFRPVRFEYKLSQEDGGSVLSVPIGNGASVNIRGTVDRVDTYTAPDGKRYLRVIDYKTGNKVFSFDDIYNGINLQLLLYIVALTEGSDPEFKDCIPGGILYMRAGFLECKDDFDPLDNDAKSRLKRLSKQLRRNGLIVGIDDSVEAMDENFSGDYAPVTKNRDGTYSKSSGLISPNAFKLLEEFAKRRVAEFGLGLLSGKIDARPTGSDSEHLYCAYCDYSSVCDRKKYMYKIINKSDGELLKLEISKGDVRDV